MKAREAAGAYMSCWGGSGRGGAASLIRIQRNLVSRVGSLEASWESAENRQAGDS